MGLGSFIEKKLAASKAAAKNLDSKKWSDRLASAGEKGAKISKGLTQGLEINPSGSSSGLYFDPDPAGGFGFVSEGHRRHERHESRSHERREHNGDIHIHVHNERRRRR